jgi:zinc protease
MAMLDIQTDLPDLDVGSLPGPDDISRQELANGIVVLARESFTSPSVVISGFVRAGSNQVAPEQAGLCDMTAYALSRGTANRSFGEIHESLESIGASLGFGTGNHSTGFRAKGLAEDLDLLLDVLSDVLRNPTFPAEQVDRLRGERLTALAIRDQNTGAVAQRAFNALIYPHHPYGVPSDGYRETVANLSPKDLRDFHRSCYGPRGTVISIVGGTERRRAVARVQESLSDWENAGQLEAADLPPVDAPSSLLREDVPLEGKSQCDIVIGAPGPSRTDPDYLAASLGNNILGRFGLQGRIGDVVREKEGLAYSAGSTVAGGPGPGPWHVDAGVNPQNIERAIDLIRSEIERFVTKRVAREELEDNQAHFIGRLPLQLESNEGVSGALLQMERYQLGLDYLRRYPGLVAAVTRTQILETASRFLDSDRLGIGVAGPVGDE